MTHSYVSVIPANAGTHGLARLLDCAVARRTLSMSPGLRRDDGRWRDHSHRNDLQKSPEYPR
jgi:hypothetical protein